MSSKMLQSEAVTSLKGVGPAKADALSRLGIASIGDLLCFYPYKYKDKRQAILSDQVQSGRDVLAQGELLSKQSRRISGGRVIVEARFKDEAGFLHASFFNMPFMAKSLCIGSDYVIFGKATVRNGFVGFTNPEIYPKGSSQDIRGLMPVYHACKGITSKEIAKLTYTAIESAETIPEWIDSDIVQERRICSREMMQRGLHYPSSRDAYRIARYRMIYETLLIHQLSVELSRRRLADYGESASLGAYDELEYDDFARGLGFELTKDQIDAIEDIRRDLSSDRPMNRLVQGDVGSGKTAVAEAAIVMAKRAGYQSAFMVPTEVLARQHAAKLTEDYRECGVSVALLTSSVTASERRNILKRLKDGELDCIIGTHALIQDDVEFASLGLVITDEQHRFGVKQRKSIALKGSSVNVCVMSATPIPRTLANTVYGDMDFSIIREKPKGRLPVITRAVNADSEERAYVALKAELDKGGRAYVIAPSIDSDDEELASATRLYERLSRKYSDYNVGILHGRMDRDEKENVMRRFAEGDIQVLAATVVVEVGVDVPEATIIVIENAERFGLSQLHQLRGRVGRSDVQSYCYLINHSDSETAKERIRLMTMHNDGFVLSEEDYRLRGPGDIMGTMQHGDGGSGIAELLRYTSILEAASEDARTMVSRASAERLSELEMKCGRLKTYDNSNVI